MKHILVYTPDGTGIRNYMYSSVFKNRDAHLSLLHNFEDDIVHLLHKEVQLQSTIKLPAFKESLKEKFLREIICLSRLRYNATLKSNPSLLDNFNKKTDSLKLKLFYAAVRFAAQCMKSYASIEKADQLYQKTIAKNPFTQAVENLLEHKSIDSLFLTHQRAIEAPYVFSAARKAKIPTTTVIYSWDNLPKARLYVNADQYLVWSDYMRQEMREYYPEISEAKVKVTGTPQFSFYADDDLIQDRKAFATQYGLDPVKKWICFSGDDTTTSPYDADYLRDLAEAIANSSLQDSYQILFRRCPVDFTDRYDPVIHSHKDLIIPVSPLWLQASAWSAVFPKKEDVGLLVNTAYHCEAVFNIGSTMVFDFYQFNKPCVYFNYETRQGSWKAKRVYDFQHFRSMTSEDAVIWARSKKDLQNILENIDQKEVNTLAAGQWFQKIVSHPVTSNDLIYQALITD